jgi:hypothetical protein
VSRVDTRPNIARDDFDGGARVAATRFRVCRNGVPRQIGIHHHFKVQLAEIEADRFELAEERESFCLTEHDDLSCFPLLWRS